jgi:uncharacterized membrane protein
MVEIATKALSPGINDPYTAMSCIDNLTSSLSQLLIVRFPATHTFDNDGKLRIIAKSLNYEGMLNAAFNQIRQFAEGSPAVVIRLMEAMVTLNKFAKRKEHKNAIQKHAQMILNMAEKSFQEPNDMKDLKKRSLSIFSFENLS